MNDWSDIKPKDDIRVEVETADLRALVEIILKKGQAVAEAAFPSYDQARPFLKELEIGNRLWLGVMLHTGKTVELDNQVFTAFMQLVARAEMAEADLELPEKLQKLLDNLPMPDESIVPLNRSLQARR